MGKSSKKKKTGSKKKRTKAPVKRAEPEKPKEPEKNDKIDKSTEPLQKYDISQRTHERRAALQADARQWGTLKIMKQLNHVREGQQWNPRAHEILTKDLEYLEKEYTKEKQA